MTKKLPWAAPHLSAANLLTTAGAACGLAAVVLTLEGLEPAALTALMAAVLFDRLDGIVARRLGQSSDFGRELDSLADAVSFLVAPALMVAVISQANPLACLAAGLFVLAGLWRLAHFNLTGLQDLHGSPAFSGLPTTMAAALFVLAWTGLRLSPLAAHTPALLAALLAVLAPLMLSSLPVKKRGLLMGALQLLALPTLVAAWWPT